MPTDLFFCSSRFLIRVALAFLLAGSGMTQNSGTSEPKLSTDPWKEQEITGWNDLRIIRVDLHQLFLQGRGATRKLVYTDKDQHCFVNANFLNETHVLVRSCSKGTFVTDLGGAVQYKLPRFRFPEITPNKTGTRFAVFERGRSALHELGDGTYDKLGLFVYSTEDGKKLFERSWSGASGESESTISLSDDGSTLYLHWGGVKAFSIPVPSSK